MEMEETQNRARTSQNLLNTHLLARIRTPVELLCSMTADGANKEHVSTQKFVIIHDVFTTKESVVAV